MILCLLSMYMFMSISLIFYFLSLEFVSLGLEIFVEYSILSLNSVEFKFSIFLDWVSLMFTSFVFFISSMIFLYSWGYMGEDKTLKRFIYTMVLFVVSMMMVIFSSNLVFILLGWDGLGLVSYALVIYYQNVKSYNAAMLTALSNRIGDVAILLGIAMMMNLGSWSYLDMYSILKGDEVTSLSLLIILASMTKSAQIPFSSWLPAAMAAPTPVSSLVHSSTLVTAGIYLLFRFSMFLSYDVKMICVYFSLFTMFMAGLVANFEFDLKKIIALSTLSQLGMMMVIYFMGEKYLAFFHLLMHALFKALLFMCAGVVIHSIGGYQDIRFMGGLVKVYPVTSSCFWVSNMALCGLPFLSGFYSKDLIVEILSMSSFNSWIYMIFYISIGLTVSYSMRLSIYMFIGQYSIQGTNFLSEKDSNLMLKSMMVLVFLAIVKGATGVWLMFCTPCFIILPMSMKLMVLIIIGMGGILGYELTYLAVSYSSSSMNFYQLSMFISGMWNLPVLSTSSLNSMVLKLGEVYIKNMDYGWIEFYGCKGVFSLIKMLAQNFQLVFHVHMKIFLFIMWVLLGCSVFFIEL
uniref:NADH-ubiquinone oxidoreductase chain 5 n=1 Tax=Trigonopterus porg TaxID=2678944 RepID=A0A7H1KI51_9CUCU|nr:NADH dehydrogenase subunit 5 [Trigonopterus porg]QNT26967.1 NADH dehydrogenase subunit 5 [Trigonopterus porg]